MTQEKAEEQIELIEQQRSMKKLLTHYFQELYPGKKFDIVQKNRGTQLGCEVQVILNKSGAKHDFIRFYAKTFSNGTSYKYNHWIIASSIVPDLKEVFVYKVLEHLGLGPKCHFIGDSSKKEFYIATQDLGYTKQLNKNKQYTVFFDTENQQLLESKPLIKLLCLDLCVKIFYLEDIHEENIGQTLVNTAKDKWHVHDFKINFQKLNHSSAEEVLSMEDNDLIFIEEKTFPCCYYYLNKTNQELVVDEFIAYLHQARKILLEGRESTTFSRKPPLQHALTLALEDVKQFIELHCDGSFESDTFEDLIRYIEAINNNFNLLKSADFSSLMGNKELIFQSPL